MAGNITAYMPNQVTNWEQYFNQNNYEGKDADFCGELTTLRPFFTSRTASFFSIFRRKKFVSDPSETDIKEVIPAPTQQIKT